VNRKLTGLLTPHSLLTAVRDIAAPVVIAPNRPGSEVSNSPTKQRSGSNELFTMFSTPRNTSSWLLSMLYELRRPKALPAIPTRLELPHYSVSHGCVRTNTKMFHCTGNERSKSPTDHLLEKRSLVCPWCDDAVCIDFGDLYITSVTTFSFNRKKV
jgi:hypothetical protein